MKKCIKCLEFKELTEFYGHGNICRECRSRYSLLYYNLNKERIRLVEKKYRRTAKGSDVSRFAKKKYQETENGRTKKRESDKKYRTANKLKITAQKTLYLAVKNGTIKRGSCEVCKSTHKIEAHHTDYHKPLDVVWLCNKHHNEYHGKTYRTTKIIPAKPF